MLDWTLSRGGRKAITFDPAKLSSSSSPGREKTSYEPLTPKDSITWLGVILDSRLTFKQHVQAQAAKACKVANFTRSLNKTKKGSSARAVMTAAKAIVTPIALYGADV